jgi:hypothetical protein
MSSNPDLDRIEPELDEIAEDAFLPRDPIATCLGRRPHYLHWLLEVR